MLVMIAVGPSGGRMGWPRWPAAPSRGGLPQAGGVRPQLLVTVELDSLVGRPGAMGGEAGWVGPLAPAACQRLACDGTLTRVLVTHHPNHEVPAGAGGARTHLCEDLAPRAQ
jgi:hypothetical protein